ncbi:MAG: DNA polymerase III subunit delta [Clostridia bacterium]|jgi:DNA polymerase III subunit delta|nr:DNA polymerase III subunit delta [Clostridia bacterium]MBT7123325.1 DNA polymerase III subunit delta [Clostridia bacterium]
MNNIYLFCGDSFLIKKNVKTLRESLNIQNGQLNVATFRDMPSVDELVGACAQVPFMSDKRLVILRDAALLAAKSNAEEGKRLAEYLADLPSTTVLVMCYEGAPDKRRVLYKQIGKLGQLKEYADPKPDACVAFAVGEAKKASVGVSSTVARELVDLVGCDYFALRNEIEKLAIYSDGDEITSAHIKECVSRSLEVDVFELHKLFVQKKAAKAAALLQGIMADSRPEALIGLIAYNFREMYKIKVMLDLKYSVGKITAVMKSRDFIVRRRAGECKRFSQAELKESLVLLANLDYAIKSGTQDATLAMNAALVSIYKL